MKIFAAYNRIPLIYRNLGAFAAGCIAGVIIYKLGDIYGQEFLDRTVSILSPFGNILVNMLKMIVIPIIFFSLINGAASVPAKTFGKMGTWVCSWYVLTSLYAAVFGCAMAFLFNPKLDAAKKLSADMAQQAAEFQSSASGVNNALLSILHNLFTNPFQALAQGNFLPVIVFAILFGLAARVVMDNASTERTGRIMKQMLEVIEALQLAVFKIIDWVMAYFPIGIFALTACSFAVYGVNLFQSYFQLAICVICGVLLMLFVCYPAIMLLFCRHNPYPVMWKLREPVLTAFVTRSSAAALPVSLQTANSKLHVKGELANFTLSLGATVNMDGVCIHLPVFAVLASNLFGFDISIGQIFLLVLSVVLVSIGTGGVPGGSIFMLFMILGIFNLTPEQTSVIIALALGINPLLDMFETACNVAGDNICTYVAGKKLGMIEEK